MKMQNIDALAAKMIYIVLVVFTKVRTYFPIVFSPSLLYSLELTLVAHTGPNAGYEERRHKWTKYTKPQTLAIS